MNSRDFYIKAFIDTLKVNYTKQNILYDESYNFNIKNKTIKIIWSNNTVKTILSLPENIHIAALNFADPYSPGGLVKYGVRTQEECLCQSSTLYRALNKKDNFNFYYNYNLKKGRNNRQNNI